MKIAIFELEDWEHEAFKKLSHDHELSMTDITVSSDLKGRFTDAEIISTFIYSDLSAESLKQFENLKLISTRSTGFDHIDVNYCKQKGITICNVPNYGERTVAEHVFALLLGISHRIVEGSSRTKNGNFSPKGLQGFDLENKVLGVIGTGAIGRCVIEIARGFKMKIIAFDRKVDEQAAVSLGFRYTSMDELLSISDIITLHVPGSPATHNLLSRPQFALMKDGVVLINTSRGDIIDVQVLVEAIVNKKVSAAGLDVLPEEPVIREEAELLCSIFIKKYNLENLLADQILPRLPNVLITPHSAFNTRKAVSRLLDTTRQNIISFISGKVENVVVQGTQRATVIM